MHKQSQKYVVIKGSGGAGLGDKIRALGVGILVAQYTGRTLWVDWQDSAYGNNDENLFPHLFSISGVDSTNCCPDVFTTRPEIWKDSLAISLDDFRALDLIDRGIQWSGDAPPWDHLEAMKRYSWDMSSMMEELADAVVITTFLSLTQAVSALQVAGHLDNKVDPAKVLGQSLKNHLRFHPTINEKVKAFSDTHNFHKKTTVGIHVRCTQESQSARAMPLIKDYLSVASKALRRHPKAQIFLSTDNSKVVDIFRSSFGEDRIITIDKWFAPPGQSLHKNILCPDGLTCVRDALLDMALLAHCDYLITLGNSSFSIVSAYLSRAPSRNKQIIFPQRSVLERLISKLKFGFLFLLSFSETINSILTDSFLITYFSVSCRKK